MKKYYLLIKKNKQIIIIQQAKFTYSLLGKAFEKQTKIIEDQGKKKIDALNSLKSKELDAIKNTKSDDNGKSLIYK